MSRALLIILLVWAAPSARIAAAPNPHPAARFSAAVAGVATQPASPAPAAPSAPARQRSAPQDPRDGGDSGGNHGLGWLPKGVDPEYEGLGVVCVSSHTGRPIPDVRVRSLTQVEIDAWSERNPGFRVEEVDPEWVLASSTVSVKTSAYGVTITPSGPGRMLVDARSGALYAYAWVDRNVDSQVRLSMIEDKHVAFQTLAPGGEPRPDVAVVVRDSSCTDVWRGVTGDDGLAYMRHAAFLIARDATPGACLALVEGVLPASRPVVLQRASLPADSVALTAPESRRLLVRVKDPAGAPVSEPVAVTVRPAAGTDCADQVTRVASGGEAAFERVGTGLEGVVVEVDGGGVYAPVRATVRVDATTEQPIVDVAFERRYPVARLQLVDAQDQPLADRSGAAWRETDDVGALEQRVEVRTDAEGRLALPLAMPAQRGRPQKLVVVLRDGAGDWASIARMPVEPGLSGMKDFGRVQVEELPIVAQGYVLDERDAAVPDAIVEVASSSDPDMPPALFAPDPRWTSVADMRGRFKVRGLPTGERVALTASAVDHVRPPFMPVERGDRRVKIELSRTASLTGKLLLPANLASDAIHLWIESGGDVLPVTIGPNDLFRAAGIPPGTMRLVVLVDGVEEPVYSVDDVDVKAGVEIKDPRIVQVDLRQQILAVSIRVMDAQGESIPDATLEIVEPAEDGEATQRSVTVVGGIARFVTRAPAVDVTVRASGYEPLALRGVDKDAEVRLVRARR